MAAFVLLAGLAHRTPRRGNCRAGGGGNRPTEDTSMTGKKTAKGTETPTVVVNDPNDRKGRLKALGG